MTEVSRPPEYASTTLPRRVDVMSARPMRDWDKRLV